MSHLVISQSKSGLHLRLYDWAGGWACDDGLTGNEDVLRNRHLRWHLVDSRDLARKTNGPEITPGAVVNTGLGKNAGFVVKPGVGAKNGVGVKNGAGAKNGVGTRTWFGMKTGMGAIS